MKAVVGILVIFIGFFIEYSVFTGKLPPQGGITSSPASGIANLPTGQNISSGFQATTGQGSPGNTATSTPYNGPSVRGAF